MTNNQDQFGKKGDASENKERLGGVFEEAPQKWEFRDETTLRAAYFLAMSSVVDFFTAFYAWSCHSGSAGAMAGREFGHQEFPKRIEVINSCYSENAAQIGISIEPPFTIETPQIQELYKRFE